MSKVATDLEVKLLERVRREGPITFRDFMQTALYDSEFGYYNTERLKIGSQGDYYTSSNVHPAFGAVLARAFAEWWTGLPEPQMLVEIGPGNGQLAADILSAMQDEHPAVYDQLSYILVELSPPMRRLQKKALENFEDKVSWLALEHPALEGVCGIAFSNEFVDALPVHRIRQNPSIEEQYVTTVDGANLCFCWREPSTDKLAEYVDRIGIEPRRGQIVEINLDARDWLARMSRILGQGLLVTIDYGDMAEQLWAPDRVSGTLRSFYRHTLTDSPLERIGEQDITAGVNFTALIEYGRELGFEVLSFERQAAFLTRLGLIERIASQYDPSASLDDLKQRLAVKNLFVPGGISDSFRVLVQSIKYERLLKLPTNCDIFISR